MSIADISDGELADRVDAAIARCAFSGVVRVDRGGGVALEFRILGLHLEGLADIALTPPERGHDQFLAYARPIEGRIELRNVCFRYAETEPLILENVNLTVEPRGPRILSRTSSDDLPVIFTPSTSTILSP